jgi:hypothetical protein
LISAAVMEESEEIGNGSKRTGAQLLLYSIVLLVHFKTKVDQ